MATIVHIATIPESLHFLRGQVSYLTARGWQVHAIASPGKALDDFGQREAIPVHAVSLERRIAPGRDLASVARLSQLLRELRPQIAHAHTPKAGLLGMLAAAATGVPVRIYHLHGLPLMTAWGAKRLLLQATEMSAAALSHQVLCVSRSLADAAIREQLCPDRKVAVLGSGSINGVDAQTTFHPRRGDRAAVSHVRRACGIPEKAQVVGFVGRLVRDKGVHELAAAWRVLRAEFPALHLLVAGVFEDGDAVSREVRQTLASDPRVHLTGWVDDVAPYYAAMDVLALPTHREGFGCVAIECAAMERPVVATRIPGCLDSVRDQVTGTLVPPGDVASLAAALGSYLRDPALRRRHGEAGRARVLREFRPEVLWEANHQNYLSWLARRRLPLPLDGKIHSLPGRLAA